MEIYTIGFTQRTAERFFGRLKQGRRRRLLDVRLNNTSQLAGFAKASDLPYFLGSWSAPATSTSRYSPRRGDPRRLQEAAKASGRHTCATSTP